MARRERLRLSLAAAAALVAGCGGVAEEPRGRPLVAPDRVPDLLVEAREVSFPPSPGGNRFLSGWWPDRWRGEANLTALAAGGRLEVVHLGRRERRLLVDLVDEAVTPGGAVGIRVAGRDLGPRPLVDPLEVRLPADLPAGRVAVEIVPLDATRVVARAASARPVLPRGDAAFDGADVLQTGDSILDFVRHVPAGAVLSGVFQPPGAPRRGQEFLLHTQRDGGSRTAFHWRATLAGRLRGGRAFEVPLGAATGFVRVRLEARGEGPAGRWNGLAIAGPEPSPPAVAAEPPAVPERPSLVILYVMDALRADRVGHLGGPPGSSPTLDRLAAEGFSFSSHRSVAPNTQPSTKALMTGEAWVEGGGSKLPAGGPATLAEVFRRAGYRTALFSNNPYVSAEFGLARGYDHHAAPEGEAADFHDDAAKIHAAALAWLRTLPPGEPAFLYLHTLHPHNPYDPPPAHRARFVAGVASTIDGSTATLLDLQKHRRPASPADRERLRGLYAGGLAYNDAELAGFLAAVEELHPAGGTLLAVTSDHGEELFDHGGVLHGYTLYEEMIRIPLVLWSPGRIAPGRSRTPTSTLDLHATLAELAGGGVPSEGRSLWPELSGAAREARPEIHLAAAANLEGGVFSAQSRRLKLVWAPRTGLRWGMGNGPGRTADPEYLFDLESDPGEQVNLAGYGGLEAAWLKERLLAWVRSKRGAAPAAEPEVDEETRKRLEALGYVD